MNLFTQKFNNLSFKYMISFLFISLLPGCGGDNHEKPKVVIKPYVYNVRINGEVRIDEIINGSFKFEANDIHESDASITFWKKSDGTKIAEGREIRIVEEYLIGEKIAFCVTPINSGNRLRGDTVCSEYTTIHKRKSVRVPEVTFLRSGEEIEVGNTLLVLVDGMIQDHEIRWYADDFLVPGQSNERLKLTKEHEDKRIHACAIINKDNQIISCSNKTKKILGKRGTAPSINILTTNSNCEKAVVGSTVSALTSYVDEDGDVEDINKRQYRWYKGSSIIGSNKSIFVSHNLLYSKIKVCVTVYSKSGRPKASNPFCSKDIYIVENKSVAPIVSEIDVKGINMEGYIVQGNYKYFDGNSDLEADTKLEWSFDKNGEDTFSYNKTLRLSKEIINKAKEIDPNLPLIYFCVTPRDQTKQEGKKVCHELKIGKLNFSGSLIAGEDIKVDIANLPEILDSWWQIKGYLFNKTYENKDNTLTLEKNISRFDSINLGYRTLEFCTRVKDLNDKQTDICSEVTNNNNKVNGAYTSVYHGKKVVYDPLPHFDLEFEGNRYRIYRPILKGHFVFVGGLRRFSSASFVRYHTMLREKDNSVTGVELSPLDAEKFCRTISTGLVPFEILKKAYWDDKRQIFNAWPSFNESNWVVSDGKNSQFEFSYLRDIDSEYPIHKTIANPNKKYRFLCFHKLTKNSF